MKTNQLIKHITSVVLIGFMLFTCMSLVGLNREDSYGAAEKTATIYVTMSVKGAVSYTHLLDFCIFYLWYFWTEYLLQW